MFDQSFDVFYCGQLRFVEVIDYHDNFLEGCSKINAVFTPLLIEKPIIGNISARYSVDEHKTYQESLDFFKNKYKNSSIVEVDEAEISSSIDKDHFYRLNRLFLFLKYFKSEDDFTVILTTDLIFRKKTSVRKVLQASFIPNDIPIIIAHKSKQPYLGESGFFILNRLAADRIKKLNIEILINVFQKEGYESPDEIWTDFFRFCGITFLPTWPDYQSQRFKPNMMLSDLDDEPRAIQKMIEYHKFKMGIYDKRKQ
jgi:hypothetical protein